VVLDPVEEPEGLGLALGAAASLALRWHCSSAVPVRPTQFGEVPPLEAPAAEPEGLSPIVPPAVVPGAPGSVVLVLELVPPELALSPAPPEPVLLASPPELSLLLAPALAPDEPLAPLSLLPCAHAAFARPSVTAVIAAVSTFIVNMWNAL
jgi:hypothetical protein